MLYDYQYDIGAIIISTLLLVIYGLKNKYRTKSNHIFYIMTTSNLMASIFDLISCFTISFPENFPIVLNYAVSMGFLFCYNMMSIFYFAYVDAIGKVEKYRKFAKITQIVTTLYLAITIFTTPFTHLIFYFDENLKYCHGLLMPTLYILPFIIFILDIVVLIEGKSRFNKYQVATSIMLIASMSIAVIVNIIFPHVLIGQMVISIIMVFIYIAHENPAYFTYKDTQCLNRHAFNRKIKEMIKENKSFDAIIIEQTNLNYLNQNNSSTEMEKIHRKIAETLYLNFKEKVYNFSSNKYIVLIPHDKLSDSINTINRIFSQPFKSTILTLTINIKVSTIISANEYSSKEIELLAEYNNDNIIENDTQEAIKQIRENITKKQDIQNAIEKAIQNDSFQVYYQPIYDVNKGKYRSAEALIRLFDDDLGFINPEELIIIAENRGYIEKIGEIVFKKVCKFIHDNNIKNLGLEYIEINLSPIQCANKNIVDTFSKIMESYNVNPSQINLEITETAQLSNDLQVLKNIELFNNMGVKFSIDDYGSGFASANYLVKLPVSLVKIDKDILWMAMKDENAMTILKNTIKMIKELNKEIVVEGVEDEKMVEMLKREKCDFNQGYFFSKPINDKDFIEFLNTNNA